MIRQINGVDIETPDVAMVFSDTICIVRKSGNVSEVRFKAGIEERREMYHDECMFDIAPFIKFQFDATNINRVDGSISINPTYGKIEIEVIIVEDGIEKSGVFIQKYVWGSFGLNDSYCRHRHLSWNPNYPFTIDINALPQYISGDEQIKYTDASVTVDGKTVTVPIEIIDRCTRYDMTNFVKNVKPHGSIHISIMDCVDIDNCNVIHRLHTIDVDIDNRTNGVYLRWIDRLGRLCYRLFAKSSETRQLKSESNYAKTDRTRKMYIGYGAEKYNPGEERYNILSEECRYVIGIGAQDEEQMRELLTLTGSPMVDMFMGYGNSIPMWQRVIIHPASYSRTNKKFQDFSVQIDVPSESLQNI